MIQSTDTAGRTRTVVGHSDPTVREALRDLTVQGLGMRVVAEAGDAATLLAQVEAERPDLVIVAWQFVAADAVAALRELRSEPGTRVVVLGQRPDRRHDAVAAGADAYISMVDAPDVVAAILAGRAPAGPATQRRSGIAGGEKTHEPKDLS